MDKNLVMKELQKPFREEEIEWRVGATNKEKTMGLALPYVTNKAIQNRLDEVFGVFGWKNEYKEWKANSQLCGISIWDEDKGEWLTKWDGADDTAMESTKGGLSDSMKRAAVQFGIGRYLYKLDPMWVPLKDGKYLEYNPPLPLWALPDEEQEAIRKQYKAIESEEANKNRAHKPKSNNKPIKSDIASEEASTVSDTKETYSQNTKAATDVDVPYENSVSDDRPKNLISEKQIGLFNVRAKNKSRNKVYEIIGKFGYETVESIEKKNFNNILYYIDQLPLLTKAMA